MFSFRLSFRFLPVFARGVLCCELGTRSITVTAIAIAARMPATRMIVNCFCIIPNIGDYYLKRFYQTLSQKFNLFVVY